MQKQLSANSAQQNEVHEVMLLTQQRATTVAVRATSKKQQVINMCAAANGTTVAEVARALLISKDAARSLFGDIRHDYAARKANSVLVVYNGTVYKTA